MADETEKDETQDVSAFLGVDPIYMNYSDERNKPFRAEPDEDANDGEGNQADIDTEDVAYSHQEWTREDGLQDPVTGEALDVNPADIAKAKRELYKDPNWGPNVPHAMTGAGQVTTTESQSSNSSSDSTNTGSTETVQADGTTGDTKTSDSTPASGDDSSKTTTTAPTAPSAPKAASTKKTAASDNK